MKKIVSVLLSACLVSLLFTACSDSSSSDSSEDATSSTEFVPSDASVSAESAVSSDESTVQSSSEMQFTSSATVVSSQKTASSEKAQSSKAATVQASSAAPSSAASSVQSAAKQEDDTYLKKALHDLALSATLIKQYESKANPTSVVGSDGKNIATVAYFANGSLDSVTTNANTLIAHQYSKAKIMCDITLCPGSAAALEAHSAITKGSYDFTANTSGVKVYVNALTKDITLEAFSALANNTAVTAELLQTMKAQLGSGQVGAIIYGLSSGGKTVGKYVFMNPSWFFEASPKAAYFCIDSENTANFGKSISADYTASYKLVP